MSVCRSVLAYALLTSWPLAAFAGVSVTQFGARCDGATDDTAAFNFALSQENHAISPTGTLTIPEGKPCRITAPISVVVSGSSTGIWAPSIEGEGSDSSILVDYGAWNTKNGDYVAIEYLSNAPYTTQTPKTIRVGNFQLIASSAGSTASIAFSSHTNVSGPKANDISFAPIVRGELHNITLSGFSVGFDLQEMWLSDLHDIHTQNVGQLIHIHGEVVNCNFSHLYYPNSLNNSSTAILIESKVYGSRLVQPEGITFSESTIYGAKTLLDIESGYIVNVHSNILDGATGDAVIINSPSHISFLHNYVFSLAANGSLIRFPTLLVSVTDVGSIEDNYLLGNGKTNGQYGLVINAGGIARFGLRFSNNRLSNLATPVYIAKSPFSSWFRDNFFVNNKNDEIKVGDNANTVNVFVDGNSSNESNILFSAPAGVTGYIVGKNCTGNGMCTP